MDNTEILVHVSASTTRRNDEIYRTLADAYLAFEPCELPQFDTTRSIIPQVLTPVLRNDDIININATTSRDSYGSFPSRLGSGHKLSSQERSDVLASIGSSQEDLMRPPSRLEQLERIHARWRDQRNVRPSIVEDHLPSNRMPVSSDVRSSSFVEDTQLALHVVESQLSDQFSTTSEDTPDDEAGIKVSRSPLKLATGNVRHEQQDFSKVQTQSPKSMKADFYSQASTSGERPAIGIQLRRSPRLARSISKSLSKEIGESGLSVSFASQMQEFPLVVCPPTPKITIESPGTLPSQLTSFLQTVRQQNPERFKPSSKTRILDRDERGHWAVDCGMWPHRVRLDFWSSLCDHIRTGRLGWGVTLHRDFAQPSKLDSLQLYCWGEIVEHIWLSLWLCSKGKISQSGSTPRPTWKDAEDKVVIKMQ